MWVPPPNTRGLKLGSRLQGFTEYCKNNPTIIINYFLSFHVYNPPWPANKIFVERKNTNFFFPLLHKHLTKPLLPLDIIVLLKVSPRYTAVLQFFLEKLRQREFNSSDFTPAPSPSHPRWVQRASVYVCETADTPNWNAFPKLLSFHNPEEVMERFISRNCRGR